MQWNDSSGTVASRQRGSSNDGNGSVLISAFMPSKKGDGGAIGRRMLLHGMLMGGDRLGRWVVDDVAEAKPASVNLILTAMECVSKIIWEK